MNYREELEEDVRQAMEAARRQNAVVQAEQKAKDRFVQRRAHYLDNFYRRKNDGGDPSLQSLVEASVVFFMGPERGVLPGSAARRGDSGGAMAFAEGEAGSPGTDGATGTGAAGQTTTPPSSGTTPTPGEVPLGSRDWGYWRQMPWQDETLPTSAADPSEKGVGIDGWDYLSGSRGQLEGVVHHPKRLDPPDMSHLPPDLTSGEEKLIFDGKHLTYWNDGKMQKYWGGVSGKKGFQSKEHQGDKSKGPIPEGAWKVQQANLQELDSPEKLAEAWGNHAVQKVVNRFGSGEKIGSYSSGVVGWGKQRVWLEPDEQTDIKGRGGFSIHGGWFPGSAGCVDLTNNMEDFSEWFKGHGRDINLHVKY
ncbi:MAG: hypothetical protein HQL56_00935 [Magnetococcales bacterium]|nr:hypothetical protein [Magnetococcales bacterium]